MGCHVRPATQLRPQTGETILTLANDVKAKLAFQPDDAAPLTMELHELEEGLIAWLRVVNPARIAGKNESLQMVETATYALWTDYLINGLSPGMAVRALLTVTK
jgi:hypothetical protein